MKVNGKDVDLFVEIDPELYGPFVPEENDVLMFY